MPTPFPSELANLLSKKCFEQALHYAAKLHLSKKHTASIYKEWGDYAFDLREYDVCIDKYVKTIGFLDTAHVIKKFMDAPLVTWLILYLEAVHAAGVQTSMHTRLLAACYANSGLPAKIAGLVKAQAYENIDYRVVVDQLRKTALWTDALEVCVLKKDEDLRAVVLIEDMRDFESVFSIARDNALFLYACVKNHARQLCKAPDKYLQLLLDVLQLVKTSDRPPLDSYDAMVQIQLSPCNLSHECQASILADRAKFIDMLNTPSLFTNEPVLHIKFLEAKIQHLEINNEYNLLIELYLQAEQAEKNGMHHSKVLELLKRKHAHYNEGAAMLACARHAFSTGLLFFYQKQRNFYQIFKYYVDADEYASALSTCREYGAVCPQLWHEALVFFCNKGATCQVYVDALLDEITEKGVFTPVEVFEILGASDATFGNVKTYLADIVKRRCDEEAALERKIQDLEQRLDEVSAEYAEASKAYVVLHSERCALCLGALNVPVAYFYCKHSFHLKCIGAKTAECPRCARGKPDVQRVEKMTYEKFCAGVKNNDDQIGYLIENLNLLSRNEGGG